MGSGSNRLGRRWRGGWCCGPFLPSTHLESNPVEQHTNLSAKRNFFWYISRAFTYAFAVVVCTDAMLFGEMITVNIRAPLAGRLAWLGGGRALAVSALVFAAGYIYSWSPLTAR
jgi:hypothetical protein